MILLLGSGISCNRLGSSQVQFENKSGEQIYYIFAYEPISPNYVFNIEPRWADSLKVLPNNASITYICSEYSRDQYILIYKQNTLQKYSYKELGEKNIYDGYFLMTYYGWEYVNFKYVYTGQKYFE